MNQIDGIDFDSMKMYEEKNSKLHKEQWSFSFCFYHLIFKLSHFYECTREYAPGGCMCLCIILIKFYDHQFRFFLSSDSFQSFMYCALIHIHIYARQIRARAYCVHGSIISQRIRTIKCESQSQATYMYMYIQYVVTRNLSYRNRGHIVLYHRCSMNASSHAHPHTPLLNKQMKSIHTHHTHAYKHTQKMSTVGEFPNWSPAKFVHYETATVLVRFSL